MLAGVQDDVGQGDLAGALQGLPEQRVDLASAPVGGQVVRGIEVLQGNFLAIDESEDLDGLGRLGMRRADFFLAQHHVATLFVLHALHDVLALDLLAGDLVHPFVADRLHAALVEPVEIDALRRGRRRQAHRYMHQAEADRAFPDRTRHAGFLLLVVTACRRPRSARGRRRRCR